MIPALLGLQPLIKSIKSSVDALPNLIQSSGGGKQQMLFTTSGSFVVPAGVSMVTVTLCGGGGGGGHGCTANSSSYTPGHGGTGGNGGCSVVGRPVPVTAGNTIPVIVGAGGIASSSNATDSWLTKGGDSSFGALVVYGGLGAVYAQYGGRTPNTQTKYNDDNLDLDSGDFYTSRFGGFGNVKANINILNPTTNSYVNQAQSVKNQVNGKFLLGNPGGTGGIFLWPHATAPNYNSEGYAGGGGGAGLGGKGGNGGLPSSYPHNQPGTVGESAAPNSGAGGGGGTGGYYTDVAYRDGKQGGNGGSGFVLVEWEK